MRFSALLVLVLGLASAAGCSNQPSTPAGPAAALLSKTGATSTGAAFMAGMDPNAECSTRAAEADGNLAGTSGVFVCVFPGNADLVSFINGGDYAANAAFVQVGQTDLIGIDGTGLSGSSPPPSSLLQSIADKVDGSVYRTGN